MEECCKWRAGLAQAARVAQGPLTAQAMLPAPEDVCYFQPRLFECPARRGPWSSQK